LIEYLYNAIRATAGEDIIITAKVADDSGAEVSGCAISLFDNEQLITTIKGLFGDGFWQFIIPAAITAELKGRYWYCICDEDHKKLCFKEPIYLV
jgi:hypothetical protein